MMNDELIHKLTPVEIIELDILSPIYDKEFREKNIHNLIRRLIDLKVVRACNYCTIRGAPIYKDTLISNIHHAILADRADITWLTYCDNDHFYALRSFYLMPMKSKADIWRIYNQKAFL
jgi:hypothetical protein